MIRNGVRSGWLVAKLFSLTVIIALGAFIAETFIAETFDVGTFDGGSLFGGYAYAMESPYAGRRVLTEEEGRMVAEAALAFAEVEFNVMGATSTGMPYLWGGRTTLAQLQEAVAVLNDEVVPAAASVAGGQSSETDGSPAATTDAASGKSAEEQAAALLAGVGVDASGLAVNALRSLGDNVRFAATAGDNPTWWADATSTMLYDFNVVHVDPARLRAGDLVFFGGTRDGEVYVNGVGVVTGRSGTRVDFVVASAREGRVIHTFARTDGDYWQGNIVGAGRFLVRE